MELAAVVFPCGEGEFASSILDWVLRVGKPELLTKEAGFGGLRGGAGGGGGRFSDEGLGLLENVGEGASEHCCGREGGVLD